MAALSSFHVYPPDGAFRRPSVLSSRVAGAVGEVLLFLWTVAVLAFSVLVMAGFFA
jgi:hypothetical protein